MDCNESHSLMSAFIDDELSAAAALRMAEHLSGCAACSAACERMREVRALVRRDGVRYRAPSHLRQRIQSALPRPPVRRRKAARLPWAWINFGAASACSVAFAWTLALYLALPSAAQRADQEIVASHARSLMVDHLADVASSDQHTVKPWFSGKLDFSPAVYDLAQQDFPLIGGRLDYLGERPVAALAYRHRRHVVNLFVWPDKAHGDAAPRSASRQGYQLLHWSQAGMRYCAVSDTGMPDLLALKRALDAHIANNSLQ